MSVEVSPRRVVIVDDDRDVRSSLDSLLRALGHRVDEAENGLTGLSRILLLKPDVAIIDIGMRDLNGYELARQVRAAPEGHALFLVALTGYGRPEDKARAHAAGFDDYLVKPVDESALIEVLERSARLSAHAPS